MAAGEGLTSGLGQTQADEGLDSAFFGGSPHGGLVDHRKLAEAGKHLALFLTAPFSFPRECGAGLTPQFRVVVGGCLHQVAVAGLDPAIEVVENIAAVLEQAWRHH